MPLPQTVTAPTPHVPNAHTKQGVPCIFFQKGYCVKGDWCPFIHGPNSLNNKAQPVPGTASASEPATIKKAFGGIEKPVQEKKVLPMNVAKPVKDSIRAKQNAEVEAAPPRKEFVVNRREPITSGINELQRYRSNHVSNGTPVSWSGRSQQPHLVDEPESMNSKDADEVSREPSPGFDVLVDDEGRDNDYYPGEDRYGMSREHEARNEYDIVHSTDYNPISAVDDELYQDPLGYNSHEHHKGRYGWEQHRVSSERMSGGPHPERRPYARSDRTSLTQDDELDLRHRLAKHKRQNGLRSVISHEHARDMQAGDRSYRGSHRDEPLNENSLSSRLRGRIRIPRRSSSPNGRDIIRSTDRGRLSPVRASISPYRGGVRDRIKGRVAEAFNNSAKNYTGQHLRRDIIGDNNSNFAAPKSLAELKNRKNVEPSRQHVTDEQSLGKRKHLMLDGNQQSGGVSFEGPKPLKEILKRKKKSIGETSGTTSIRNSSTDNEGNTEDKNVEEETDATNNEKIAPTGNDKEVHNSTSVQKIDNEEAEDGMLVEDGVNQESEAYEQKDGESDYEQEVGGEEFDFYDGENGDAVGEYPDDEDDDDEFAKKMGVMYS